MTQISPVRSSGLPRSFSAQTPVAARLEASGSNSDFSLVSNFVWPPEGTGQIEFLFPDIPEPGHAREWEVRVTWHRSPGKPIDTKDCKEWDMDHAGNRCPCPSSSHYLYLMQLPGDRRGIGLKEHSELGNWKDWLQFLRIHGGWLGRAILDSNENGSGKGLLLLHLNDLGKADLGLWVPSQKKFFYLDAESFMADPNAPLKARQSCLISPNEPLPSPFQLHAKNDQKLEGFYPFLRYNQSYLKMRIAGEEGKPAWEVSESFTGRYSEKKFSLPFDEKAGTEVKTDFLGMFHGIFQVWKRSEKRWVSERGHGPMPETFGVLSCSRLKLSILDQGPVLFTLEEEREDGTRWVYRLDPSWLSNMNGFPKIIRFIEMPVETGSRAAEFLFEEDLLKERNLASSVKKKFKIKHSDVPFGTVAI